MNIVRLLFQIVSPSEHLPNDRYTGTYNKYDRKFPKKIFRFSNNNIAIISLRLMGVFYLLHIQFINFYYMYNCVKKSNLTISFPILNIIMIEKLILYIMSYQSFAVINGESSSIILSANFISISKITLKRSASFCL